MAVVKIMPYAYSKDSDLENLCNYIINPNKTGDGYYAFGRGAEPESAFEDFCELQKLYGKTSGHRAYHVIVSFDPRYAFCAVDGLNLAYAISSYFFPSFQVLCGVHPYQEALHAHFAINTVSLNPEITHKLHFDNRVLYEFINKVNELERAYFMENMVTTA